MIRKVKDESGREWSVERVGRTSGLMSREGLGTPALEPADIIRFSCPSHPEEPEREVTAKAGPLEVLSDEELGALLKMAPKVPLP